MIFLVCVWTKVIPLSYKKNVGKPQLPASHAKIIESQVILKI